MNKPPKRVAPDDPRWMKAAIALSERGRGRTAPNPNVGCIIVRDGKVIGRGWTQPGGRPHAEALAIDAAGDIGGATVYATLEPCAHVSARGPACADLLAEARPARVVIAIGDPDSRTNGAGVARLEAAGITVACGVESDAARRAMSGFLTRQSLHRPHVTLKLATSLDGRIAMADGSSQWITGEAARAHAHLERARTDMILVGRGTLETDAPRLDVRLPGLEDRSPRRAVLGHGAAPDGWLALDRPEAVAGLSDVDHLFVEGGAGAAAAFLQTDMVDRVLLYRAPIIIGQGPSAIGAIGLTNLADAQGRWNLTDTRQLGSDRLDVYERARS